MNTSNDEELNTKIFIDLAFKSYAGFFDHNWAKSIGHLSDQTNLAQIVLDLLRDWKGAHVVARMPWLMIKSMQDMQAAFLQQNPSFSRKLVDAFKNFVVNDSKFLDHSEERNSN